MNYKEALNVLGGLLDAFDRDEHGDYFYEHGWEVCEATILAYGALQNQPFWIPVEERLPEPDTDVLARRATGMDVECYHRESGGYWSWDEYSGKWRVTHWMPLPEGPEVEV